MTPSLDFGLDDVLRARALIRRHLTPTPLRKTRVVPQRDVWLKLECWQPTGSFKVRGAIHLVHSMSEEERHRGVVAASAGNHALGVAHAVAVLGEPVPTTLFVPRSAPRAKIDRLRDFPITLRLEGQTYEEAQALALSHAARTGATFAHAFEDARTAAGQGTVALEVVEERPDVATFVVPVGGGGLITGIAVAAKALFPRVRIVAVQADASPSLRESLRTGQALLEYPAAPTLADGIAGGIGQIVFEKRGLIDDVVTVNEDAIEEAIGALAREDHVVAEGAGAIGVAAVMSGAVRTEGRTVVVVTGGNIDGDVLARVLARQA